MKKVSSVLDPEFKREVEKVLARFKKDLYELHDLATKDEKTGIYNHRFFKNVFELEIERAKRGKQKLSIAVIDIDFFKKFNDTYGHLFGDEILRELAESLQNTIRKYDVLARFGGEEFFVLLPGATVKMAKMAAERMRKGLHNSSQLKKYNVTVSIGVTEFKKGDSMDRMIKRADKALYKAKHNGRNRVEAS
jgi:diguanylate cyclase (GGDEF)-like protein